MILTRRAVLLGGAALLIASRSGTAWAQSAPPQEAPRISPEEALRLVTNGEAVVVDVRDKRAWEGSHAEGALSLPSAEIGQRLAELPKDKLILAYCTWRAEGTSARAALELIKAGYKAAAIKGGLGAWQAAGGKVSSSK